METRPTAEEIVDHLERKIGHRFQNPDLAVHAMTHSSAKDKEFPCNERMEFLGDSILGHVVSEYLFKSFPDYEEGDLSTMKSIIVSAKTLSTLAMDLEFDKIIILGRGLNEKRSLPKSILCNAFEAVIAALYLDAGFEAARSFILAQIQAKADEILTDKHEKNYKSLLQDYAQRQLGLIPIYRVLKEIGPDHRKKFQVMVEINSKGFGPAWGSNKKESEQRAARVALVDLGLIEELESEVPVEEPEQADSVE